MVRVCEDRSTKFQINISIVSTRPGLRVGNDLLMNISLRGESLCHLTENCPHTPKMAALEIIELSIEISI